MKLASFTGNRAGVVIEDHILDLQAAAELIFELRPMPDTVLGVIQGGQLTLAALSAVVGRAASDQSLQARLKAAGALVDAATAKLGPPLPNPPLMIAAAMNYTDHLEEMKTPKPPRPQAFIKAGSTIVGGGQEIVLPPDHGDMVDWEAELALVIGKRCHRVGVEEALEYVVAYTAANDISARNWADAVMNAEPGSHPLQVVTNWGVNVLGKQYPTFCPLGPILVTSDEIPDPNDLDILCRVNGATMQHNNTANMVFSSAELVSYLSHFHDLHPGDVILTGTMGGVGIGRQPRVFLKPGDVVEVEISHIGVLRNPVSAPRPL